MNSTGGEPSPPFFVVGADRSGTTMLMMMLDAHPLLGVSRESWFLIDLMDALPLQGPLAPQQVNRAFEILREHPRWKNWGIANDVLRGALDALDHPDLRTLVETVFRLDLDRSGKTCWGDKTPAYVGEIRRIHTIFPRARFVHIIRDARDVCISLRKVGWHGPTLRDMAWYWGRQVSRGIEQGRAIGDELYLQIAYEDLVLEVEPTLVRICRFLGIPFDRAMLTWYELTAEKVADRPMKYQTKLDRAPRPSDIHRWKRELGAREVAVVEATAGATMQRAGQECRYGSVLLPLRIALGIGGRVRWVFAKVFRHS